MYEIKVLTIKLFKLINIKINAFITINLYNHYSYSFIFCEAGLSPYPSFLLHRNYEGSEKVKTKQSKK